MELGKVPRRLRAVFSAVLAAVVLVGLVAQCFATLPSVSISPESPTDADSLQISVGGWLMNGCWSFQGVQCGQPEDSAVEIDVFLHDAWLPGYVCTHWILPYCCSCTCGPLTAGHYVITVMEHHESLLDPEPEIATLEFDVVPQSAVQELSWARIRALYR
jgi:hypothetical protein